MGCLKSLIRLFNGLMRLFHPYSALKDEKLECNKVRQQVRLQIPAATCWLNLLQEFRRQIQAAIFRPQIQAANCCPNLLPEFKRPIQPANSGSKFRRKLLPEFAA